MSDPAIDDPDDELELIADGEGLAVIGNPMAVERFLVAHDLREGSRELGLSRLGSAMRAGSVAARAGAAAAEHSGRWVQLTSKSADLLKQFPAMTGSSSDVSRAIVTSHGQIQGILEFSKSGLSFATNPAMLAGVAGVMSQLAMKQAMDEISEYLAVIDAKVDDVLRSQKDAVIAEMIGVDLVIEEAMTVREHVGRVSETTWSKVQSTSLSIARTQAYALRQLDALAGKLEKERDVNDLAQLTRRAESSVAEWLSVLARCFQLQDAIGVLELDRVLDSAPDDLDRHRRALQAARASRRTQIARTTAALLGRMDAVAAAANARVLIHPIDSPATVRSSDRVATGIGEFQLVLGIDHGRESLEARKWRAAAADARDKAVETAGVARDRAVEVGVDGAQTAARLTSETLGRARGLSERLTQRLGRRRDSDTDRGDRRDRVR